MEINSLLAGLIPEENPENNNREIANTEEVSRFSGASWFDKMTHLTISIAGCGGIGSWAATSISRCMPRDMHLYDSDIVELGNLSGQCFNREDAISHRAKVYATLNNIVASNNKTLVYCNTDNYPSRNPYVSNVTISAVDSMRSRKSIFDYWYANSEEGSLFIDGRLAAEELQIYAFCKGENDKVERYKQTLFNDSEAEQTRCSYKQTAYCASMIGNLITNLVVNYANNATEGAIPRDIPFFTHYDARFLELKVEY